MTVDGSPASCRASARAVRTLGREVEQSATGLANVRTTAASAWSGEASEQFNGRARRMIDAADSLSSGLLTFAFALEAQADVIEAVRSEMQRARSIASGAGIPLAGDMFPSYGEVELEPGQEGPRDHGEAVVKRAREAEESARTTFSSAVERVMGLAWEGDPPSKAGRLTGPSDLLPDLPDLPDFTGFGLLPSPGGPVPLPIPTFDVPGFDLPDLRDPGTLAVPLITALAPRAVRIARALEPLPGEITKNLRSPSKPGQRIALGPAKAAYAQWLEDASDEHLSRTERLVRAGFVGGATATGGVAAGYACTQAAVTAPFTPICSDLGSRGGSIASNWTLEIIDDYR